MPDGLYDRDFLIWSEHQAALLRRLAAGERLNEEIDWANLIEEVEDLGRSELHSCESLLLRALVHLLKLQAAPESRDAPHWRSETVVFLDSAQRRFTPSMRTRLGLHHLFDKACKAQGLPQRDCPYALDDLLADNADVHALVARLDGPA